MIEGTILAYILYTASGILAVLFRYQLGLVHACKIIGVKISDGTTDTGYQDAITPPSSTNFTLLIWALISGLMLFTLFGFGWSEFGIVVIILLGVTILAGVSIIPNPDSTHYVRRIYHSMANRMADYQKQNDIVRADALNMLIEKVEYSFGDKLS